MIMNIFSYKFKSGLLIILLNILITPTYAQVKPTRAIEKEISLNKVTLVNGEVKEIRASKSITLSRGFRSKVEKGEKFIIGLSKKEQSDEGLTPVLPETTLSLYPNPHRGNFSIQTLSSDQKVAISIIDMGGNVVFSQEVIPNGIFDINMGQMKKGVYLLRYIQGDQVISKKIIYQ